MFIPTRHWGSSFLHLWHVLYMSEVFCYVIINVSLPFSFQQILSDFGNMAVKRKIHPGCIWVCSRWGETVSGIFNIQTIISLASFFFFFVDSVLDLFQKLTWTPGWIFPFSHVKWRSSLFLTFEETSGLLCLAVVFSVLLSLSLSLSPTFGF